MPNWINKRTRNRYKTLAPMVEREQVTRAIETVDNLDIKASEKVELFDNIITTLNNRTFLPTQYCAPFKDKTVVILGGDVVQNAEVRSELEPLGAKIIEYGETDRLLVDVIQDDVQGTNPQDISAVFAMIDYWPGRVNLLDFSLKMKSLVPTCRTAVASRFEAQDNFTKVGTPPIDGTVRLPLTGCSACRLAFQVFRRAA